MGRKHRRDKGKYAFFKIFFMFCNMNAYFDDGS